MEHEYTNRLVDEKSPYLLQHAHNPVDWYPWGDEAFEKANRENKPIFLSIGYSTCHWCHVMERESFEDEEVARVLNEGFVAIKVDREERPDLDAVYMAVAQSLTGGGGWPLNVFLTPDKKPFYAGTYFPKRTRQGKPGLLETLRTFREKWLSERQIFDQAGSKLDARLQAYFQRSQPGDPGPELLARGYKQLAKSFDTKYGGFGEAPKFPSPHQLLLLLRHWKRTGSANALQVVETTLQAMYCGGIYDHVGFGFSRYATDQRWLVPHFEKMLYDNALLAITYLETCQLTHNPFYGWVAREIFSYVLRDMTSPEGAFYSAEDADSEGEEGRFYLWTPDQVKQVLGDEQGEFFNEFYDISADGNFEGRNIPNLVNRRSELFSLGSDHSIYPTHHAPLLDGRLKLFAARETRVHPHKDDKVLTAWNGLMIAALARGSRVLGDQGYGQAAVRAAQFLLGQMRDAEGRLLARYRDGQAAYPAYLDDYAFLVWGLIELYEATFDPAWLEQALSWNRQMMDLFRDEQGGGLFFTGQGAEQLLARPKEIYDGAMPSGNSVAALNLLRLARLTGASDLEEQAAAQLGAFAGTVSEYPAGYTLYLCALDLSLNPPLEITVAGERDASDSKALLQVLRDAYLPGATVLFKPTASAGDPESSRLAVLSPLTAAREPVDGRAAAYVCRNHACQAPVTDPAALAELLDYR
jgi:uncharacterized protein YyaL (SSP411 family)